MHWAPQPDALQVGVQPLTLGEHRVVGMATSPDISEADALKRELCAAAARKLEVAIEDVEASGEHYRVRGTDRERVIAELERWVTAKGGVVPEQLSGIVQRVARALPEANPVAMIRYPLAGRVTGAAAT